ncbi:Rsd/AlgQ family anti-sigma factor [Thiohalobacter sp. IOR34]|uniref:Rsd/AlgQ family anti-sigma factor n=1 Tax=Thiohalobacter sp. IOR34 TaxID=3057176 RepID=UPI0025AF7BEC|nr:Rsd/AlgQ family anti-sigma factor [Thiohalobacter sp. IOR34]WJW76022.1 Rsd/AlgQ family anti-sigma factor [Thiohalobacter sp. IOR34]
MSVESLSSEDRRARSREKLASLVASRTETLVRYSSLAGIRPYLPEPRTEEALKRFCQALIDYAASAHFQLYRYIADGRERRQAVRAIAEQVYPQIASSTDVILDFNDRYDVAHLDDGRVERLAEDLSRLGEVLAERIQLEDQVIQAISARKRP